MAQQSLVTISEASHVLGVSEAALRQWTDEGKVRAFITPGGHRRYSMVELKKFMTSHQKVLGIKDFVAELEDTARLHREIARTHFRAAAWYDKLDEESQQHLANLGRNLLNLVIRYLTVTSDREETLKLSRDIGHEFGETLAGLGLTLTDAMEAFLGHRNPVIEAATHLTRKKEVLNRRVLEAIPQTNLVMDEALLSLVATHQQCRDGSQHELKGGITK